jgi:TonB family protein
VDEEAMTRSSLGLTLFAVAASLALHGAAYASLPRRAALGGADPVPPVTVEVVPARPRHEPPREAAVPKSEPMPEPTPPRPRTPPAPERTPAPEPVRPSGPLDLRGVTLTNEGGGDFSAPIGDGSRLDGPLRAPAPRVTTSSAPEPSAAPKPPAVAAVVPAADLSLRPEPPPLDAALRRNYPPEAERLGIGGKASVRARIEPDGRVGALSVLEESHPGFGDACRRTLAGSRWTPPRDRGGRAVPTEIRYTCRFVVSR